MERGLFFIMCANFKIRKLRFIIFILFASAFFPLGCTQTLNIKITEIGNYPRPLIEPLPLNAGVYYRNDLRTYKTIQENFMADPSAPQYGLTRITKIQLGEANIALFDFLLSHAFENLTSIQAFPNESENLKSIDLIVEPTISNYVYSEHTVFFAPGAHVRIEYTINFYSPDGLQISTWTISGESSKYITVPGVLWYSPHGFSAELTQLAMQEVATQFLVDLCNQSGINKLLNKPCDQ
jgi:hypothetical protein